MWCIVAFRLRRWQDRAQVPRIGGKRVLHEHVFYRSTPKPALPQPSDCTRALVVLAIQRTTRVTDAFRMKFVFSSNRMFVWGTPPYAKCAYNYTVRARCARL